MHHPDLLQKLDAIEAELRQLGYLRGEIRPVENVTAAFGQGQMTFEHWLSHVFLPNARSATESDDLPDRSDVGTAAVRNFDGNSEAGELISMLIEFDERIAQLAKLRRRKP
jgi:uncharacterized protein YqcC (DUF446 family)